METQTILLAIIQALFYTNIQSGNTIHDGILINYYKRSPKHLKNALVIAFLAIVPAIVFSIVTGSYIHAILLLLYPVMRMYTHSPFLNMLRGLDRSYIGKKSTKHDYSKIDAFLQIDPRTKNIQKALFLSIVATALIILISIHFNNLK